ncbi:glutamate--cysteine ligase [Algoriphagus boseongensis]|uniref:glutamate--cysteine ligase n=1 Tax=Algoriphagus boseongensis TaxID=1442587 RepID=A0A4R6TDG1_9BACT|nr:glutamate-cysteine ligase family protein [Algoriphagus boseongensis]TDQ19484.1 glutamate--cysteine ligase [Algoriphagus boseongensis]
MDYKKSSKLTESDFRDFIQTNLFEPKIWDTKISEKSPGRIGLEQEAFVWETPSDSPIPKKIIPLYYGQNDFSSLLLKMSLEKGGQTHLFESMVGLKPDRITFPSGDNFQFEPGGQVEIATSPCESLIEVQNQLEAMQSILDEVGIKNQIGFGQFGTLPWFSGEEIGLQLPKPRYRQLQNYFNSLNPNGQRMMLQTCSQHINIDLGENEEVQVRRMVVAQALAPFLTAVFANSSHLEGKFTGKKSYRSVLWRTLDSRRSGFWMPQNEISKNDLIDSYTKFALNAPLIHLKKWDQEYFGGKFTMKYWINNPILGLYPSLEDFEYHLTLLFPQVRMKGFLEIRATDALPRKWQMVPSSFISGILYFPSSLQKTYDLLINHLHQLEDFQDLASDGLDNPEIFKMTLKLSEWALEGFESLPSSFRSNQQVELLRQYLENLTWKKITPADLFLSSLNE